MMHSNDDKPVRRSRIAVIGAGPAGISAAQSAAALGAQVDWYNREKQAGGKLKEYHRLFPDRDLAENVLAEFNVDEPREEISLHFGTAVSGIESADGGFRLLSGNGIAGTADSVIVATGFEFFDAGLKEEFGYGIYKQVITSPDLERMFADDPGKLRAGGSDPSTVAFVHCVGSRDQQVGNNYCSRLCCITGIKQAIEIREAFPACRVINFYIDMRAFGSGYEELFREAQEKHHIQFIRGRVSEAAETHDHRIVLKAEDTLMARPLKVTADWLVLLTGMVPSSCPVGVDGARPVVEETGFIKSNNPFTSQSVAGTDGIFYAGACGGPVSIPEAAASGRSAAAEAFTWLRRKNGHGQNK
jgi:heterodisulfide reductase subunit A